MINLSACMRSHQPVTLNRLQPNMRAIGLCLVWAVAVVAQVPYSGSITRDGEQSVLTVESDRPLHSAATILSQEFGVVVNAEDPQYLYSGDLKEITVQGSPSRFLVPRGGRLEIRFPVHPDGSPEDFPGLLQSLIYAANAEFPFAYRIDIDSDAFTFVPTRTRDEMGTVIDIAPFLDHRVTIPAGRRSIMENVSLMTKNLSDQTGISIRCCQDFVAGVPFGLPIIDFEAHDEPARSVLMRLMRRKENGLGRSYWLMECFPPVRMRSCAIHVEYIWKSALQPPRPTQLPSDDSRWRSPGLKH